MSADEPPRNGPRWLRWLPGLQTLREYELGWLRNDIAAGIVLSTMLVPVGIAYAVASGVPAHLRPLRDDHPAARLRDVRSQPDPRPRSGFVARTHHPRSRPALSGGDPMRAVAFAERDGGRLRDRLHPGGLARLGFITELLSKPIRYGYMNGIALTVLISQLPKLFGFSVDSDGPLRDLGRSAAAIWQDKANWAGILRRGRDAATILVLKGTSACPAILVAVVGATLIVGCFDLSGRAMASRCSGRLPQGLPDFAIPWISARATSFRSWSGGLAVAIVSFADTSVLSRTYAARTGTRVDPNQEMVGLGAANLAAGFFQGFPISSSSSRTPVAEAAGAKHPDDGRRRRTGRRAAADRRAQPAAALAQCGARCGRHRRGHRPVRVRRPRADLSHPALGVLAVDRVLRWCRGLRGHSRASVSRSCIAVIEFLWDGWRPHSAVLGMPDGVEGYHDMTRYPDARRIPGLVLFRWDAPLFFANAELFSDRVLDAIAAITHAGPPACRRGRAGHQCRRHLGRRADRTRPVRCRKGTSSCASPNSRIR